MDTITPQTPGALSGMKPSPNGRYFVDLEDSPVFWLGDTQWDLFRLYTPAEALEILGDRQAKGFNVILIMLLGIESAALFPDGAPGHVNLNGDAPWIDTDPLRPNESYFRHVDEMIGLGQQTGQTFVVGVYHQWNLETIPLGTARRWAEWVARRYRDVPGLIWSMYPKATDEFVAVCRELAAGLREGDGGAHLISVHPDPSTASSSFMHDEEWLAFNMIQTSIDYDEIHEAVREDYARTPAKPVVMAEGGYEGVEFGKLQTPHHVRKQAYWSQVAGGYHVYGHTDSWTLPREWTRWLAAPGAKDMTRFRRIITSLEEWWDLIPDQTLLTDGEGSDYSLNLAGRSARGSWIVAYLSECLPISLRLDDLDSRHLVRAEWINPATEERVQAGTHAAAGSHAFTPPVGWEDAILLASR